MGVGFCLGGGACKKEQIGVKFATCKPQQNSEKCNSYNEVLWGKKCTKITRGI